MFLYIYDSNIAKEMIDAGLVMIYARPDKPLYVFLNNNSLSFDLSNTKHVFTDVLTFE